MAVKYDKDSIKTLDWYEHIRLRPGMYIGKLGDGKIEIDMEDHSCRVRDYGRGIPLEKVIDCVSKMNTGGKYDSEAFQKSVGMNGVGTKAVNALSTKFIVQSFRDGKVKRAEFSKGILVKDFKITSTTEKNGTEIYFEPDNDLFKNFRFLPAYMEEKIWNYAYLNNGLTLVMNGKDYNSPNGLLDLLHSRTDDTIRYPVIHCKGKDIEFAITHSNQEGEHYFSFVNGQHTTQGGTHQAAFREGLVKGVRDHFKKEYDASDVRNCIVGAVSVRTNPRPRQSWAAPPRPRTAPRSVPGLWILWPANWTITSTRTRTRPRSSWNASTRTKSCARNWPASRNSPTSAPRRRTSTTRSSVTAACTSQTPRTRSKARP